MIFLFQGVNYDAGFPTKFSQDENDYARPKGFSTTNSSSSSFSSGQSIYNDPPKSTSENGGCSSDEAYLLQSSILSTANASITHSSAPSSGGVGGLQDRSSLQYAANKLQEQISIPDCLAALPRWGRVPSKLSVNYVCWRSLLVYPRSKFRLWLTSNFIHGHIACEMLKTSMLFISICTYCIGVIIQFIWSLICNPIRSFRLFNV